MAAAVGKVRSTSMLRSCNGKLWQLLDSENDKLTLRYAKFVIKRRGGTGRFVSKPPVSLEWPRTGKLPFKENCITIDNNDFLAEENKCGDNEGISSVNKTNTDHINSEKDTDGAGRWKLELLNCTRLGSL